jgi:hypothetical protein
MENMPNPRGKNQYSGGRGKGGKSGGASTRTGTFKHGSKSATSSNKGVDASKSLLNIKGKKGKKG